MERLRPSIDDNSVLDPSRDRDGLPSLVTPRVVSLHGEHDRSTADDLVAMLTGATTLDDADLVVICTM